MAVPKFARHCRALPTSDNEKKGDMSNPLLAGIRVLDLSRLLPGPFCTLYLAQLGAEVIKIEEPDGGDYARTLSAELFAVVNRGKQSVALDLRRPEAVAAFKKMVAEADVVIESFRPGVMDKLGCGYETLRQINPRLVYAALTGYGQTGPYRDRAGHDMNYCGYSGVLDQLGEAGGAPVLSNVQIADLAGGALTCAVGLLSAVIGARNSGQGAFVDVGMLDGTLALQAIAVSTLRTHGRTQPRGEDMLTGALPNYGLYKCRDGKYLAIGALEPKFFQRVLEGLWQTSPQPLRRALDQALQLRKPRRRRGEAEAGNAGREPKSEPSRKKDPMAEIQNLLDKPAKARLLMRPLRWTLAAIFRLKTRDDWERLLAPRDACVSGVLTLEEALQNEQVQARGLVEMLDGKPVVACPIRFVGAQPRSGGVPALGADTEAVLRRLGLGSEEIAALAR